MVPGADADPLRPQTPSPRPRAGSRRRSDASSLPSHPLRHRLGPVASAIPGHKKEEQEIEQRQQSRDPRRPVLRIDRIRPRAAELTPDGNRYRAEVTQDTEAEDKDGEPRLVVGAPIPN